MGGQASVALLLSVRITAVLLLTPLFSAARMPASAKVVLVLGLAFALSMGWAPVNWHVISLDITMHQIASEFALGVILGLGVAVAFAAFSMAGRVLDVQIGFGLAEVFDPGTSRPTSVLDAAFSRIGLLVFLLVDGHHALLRALAASVERFPVGAPWHFAEPAEAVVRQAGGLFGLAFSLVAPAVFCILLVEVALGVVARNLPQMNMFVVALPVKVIVGLAILGLWFSGIGNVMTRVYASIESGWSQVLTSPTPGLQGSR